jgi:hypothetical protein
MIMSTCAQGRISAISYVRSDGNGGVSIFIGSNYILAKTNTTGYGRWQLSVVKLINDLMYTKHLILLAIVLASPLSVSVSVADEELPWRGYSVVDDATSRLIYGVTKSYIVTSDASPALERRIGFQCNDGQLVLTLDIGEFLSASSTDFELLVWIDQDRPRGVDMRVWSNSTSGGFSRVEAIASDLFEQMLAGTRLYWSLGETGDGTFSLIGITAASRELATNCSS